MENSAIEWTHHTFNPWIGCTKVSPGCANCYAETLMDARYGRVKWGKGNPRQRTSAANWKKPLQWNRVFAPGKCAVCGRPAPIVDRPCDCGVAGMFERPRVFCASLADWLDDEVPIEWLADLLKLIHDTPNLDWLLLTKRPENWWARMEAATKVLWNTPHAHGPFTMAAEWQEGQNPPSSVWFGTSVENQHRADERIPILQKIPVKIRFLSVEPQLTPITFRTPADLLGIHWVICGGESGANRRPFLEEWAYSLRDECKEAGVAFFMKQIDKVKPIPADLMIREFPIC